MEVFPKSFFFKWKEVLLDWCNAAAGCSTVLEKFYTVILRDLAGKLLHCEARPASSSPFLLKLDFVT